jgi:hypothetical protein
MDNVSEYFLESISIYTTHRGICTCLMNSGDCAHREENFTQLTDGSAQAYRRLMNSQDCIHREENFTQLTEGSAQTIDPDE